jgi:thiol-disulfide isomerase/thioredoxin
VRSAALALALLAGACGGAAPRAEPVRLTLAALDGGEIDLGAYRGRVVVLHVFTSWSLAAQADVPQLDQVAADHPDDVAVIGVALDDDPRFDVLAAWRAGAGAHYLITVADDGIRSGQGPLGPVAMVPITIVLDRDGRRVARVERALTAGELPRLVAGALGSK